ncbi:hypothetical protein [Acinetobacter chengduensis]|uniref:DUF4194 domain-containing protein n=1 Tax=Acinetobacter chengduensis TaxID=2420890 RepID=A0ABX9TSU8_9GAMM|nr:hypothetical protein [Acinetobacter chengduensis]RLL18982.1 hypothetical protein D9K81_14585 [Acinetobacter chengduensis]
MSNMSDAERTELNAKLTELRGNPAAFFKAMGLKTTDSELYILNKLLDHDRIKINDDLPHHESRRAFYKLVLFNFLTNPKSTTMCIANDRMAYDLRSFLLDYRDKIQESDDFRAIGNLMHITRNGVTFQAIDGRRICFAKTIDMWGLGGMGENTLYICHKPHRKLTDIENNLLLTLARHKQDKVVTFQAGNNQ